MIKIESLLAARLFLSPQRSGDRLYFISNLSGRLSLYAMDIGGSVPEPLLPPEIALQNPDLVTGYPFYLLPGLERLLVMMDRDGDENYQPMWVPIGGGLPEPAFGSAFEDYRVHLVKCDREKNIAYFGAQSRSAAIIEAYQADLVRGELRLLGGSPWGSWVVGANPAHTRAVMVDEYTIGDTVVYLWEAGQEGRRLIYGKPLEARERDERVPLNAFSSCYFSEGDRGLLFYTSLFDDRYGLGYLPLQGPGEPQPVAVRGLRHTGAGELAGLEHLKDERYLLAYNIDGCSWGYEGRFEEQAREVLVDRLIWGEGDLSEGVLQANHYDKLTDSYSLAFSTARSPAQIYTLDRRGLAVHTRERVLGVPEDWLARGEDAAYLSHDGLRISARLYLPAEALGFGGPRPLIWYVHGGPQSQERPDFTWFSMPLIQFLTLRGFAVFVPNVRGSTGYGLSYTKQVDRDWGGQDRLDHVAGLKSLAGDARLDTRRVGVVGRSYGGYMSLMLAGKHPELWGAAVDMFGPYDLLTFSERIPPTWKPYYKLAIGDPEDPAERKDLLERSPRAHLHRLACPLLVIQGANDPRVVERESRDLVEDLRRQGKPVELLVFPDEGHDVLKFENRVRCYNAITDFFVQHLHPGLGSQAGAG